MEANFDIFNSMKIINLEDSSFDTHEEQFDVNDAYGELFNSNDVYEELFNTNNAIEELTNGKFFQFDQIGFLSARNSVLDNESSEEILLPWTF